VTVDRPESLWSLTIDVFSAKFLVWISSVGRDVDLTPDAHRYFSDRYRRLAASHLARGDSAKAVRLQAQAEQHSSAGGGEGPPYAAAMAMPRPRRFVVTDAVSRKRMDGPDDAA
jgi:hypothetical protein